MIISESKAKMLQYILEAYNRGQAVPQAKNADYLLMHNGFADAVQMEIANIIGIPSVYQVTQNPIENLLGRLNFDMKPYKPGENLVYTAKGGKSYYFEMDSVGTCTISINGVVSKTFDNTLKRQFTAYKGNTGANSSDTVTITFSGDYPYNVRNVCLYPYAFPLDADVPDFTPFSSYELPSDFMRFDDKIIRKSDPRIYQKMTAYDWIKKKKVVLNTFDVGSFDIPYFKVPTKIDNSTLDTYEYEVIPEAAELIPIKVAARIISYDKPDLAVDLFNEFEKQLGRIANAPVGGTQTVQTIYQIE